MDQVATQDDSFVSTRWLKAYRAEDRAALLYPSTPLDGTERAAQAYVDRITRSAWWRRTLPKGPKHVHVFVTHAAGGWAYRRLFRKSNLPKRGWAPRITLGRQPWELRGGRSCAQDPWIILHELAHIMTYYDPDAERGHGRDFARYFMLLVRRWMGPEAAAALRESYKIERVKYVRK